MIPSIPSILALSVMFIVPLAAYSAGDILLYEDHGFSIEYPVELAVLDSWGSVPGSVSFVSSGPEEYGITVTLANGYTLPSERRTIMIDSVDLLDTVVRDLEDTCRDNILGPCWDYELLDSKIITVGGEQAISVKYRQVLEDKEATVRLVLLQDGEKFWQIAAKAAGDGGDGFEPLEAAVDSFLPVSATVPSGAVESSLSAPENRADSDIAVYRNYDVNLILVGDEWSNQVKSSVQNRNVPYVDPINYQTYERVGVRHSYDYNFVSVTGSQVGELAEFMRANSESVPLFGQDYDPPVWQAAWVERHHQDHDPEWIKYDAETGKPVFLVDYRLVDALAVEEYIYENLIGNDPDLSKPGTVNLVFLAMGMDSADFLRNYRMHSNDDATDKGFPYVGLRGYGGNYNMMFFDMYAAPWLYFYAHTGDSYVPDIEDYFPYWTESMHDCDTDKCMTSIIAFHAESALRYIVSPPLLYGVQNADRYVIDVLVYTKPGHSNTVTPASLKYFVDEEKIIREFEYLYPFADWEVRFTLENRDTRGLSQEFKRVLTDVRTEYVDVLGEKKPIQFLNSSKIQPHLISWAAERNAESQDSGTVTVPVLVEVSSVDSIGLYLDEYGVVGMAPPMPDSTEPCCALVVTSQKRTWDEQIGLTDLLIHEVGHVMGLMHSFITVTNSSYAFPTSNEYFNWYSSPMTYSSPGGACGYIYSLVYDDPCGNASLSFTEFERNMISDARLASLWEETESNAEELGAGGSRDALALLSDSRNAYDERDLYSLKGSIALAKDAYESSTSRLEPREISKSLQNADVPRVPSWVKNNAGWWADGSIDDDSFVQGIQFLIRENVISVPGAAGGADGQDTPGNVPSWVKNNAGWWADGQITDDDFLGGIEFLVSNGVIRVD